ncbi:MAG: methionine adenosyltransferase [Deltaproteobacteria bacterium]|nr:methionine adenosyltransferase [Deltaproteobacteria bacterium]TLN02642.1 MAG: methionine adenosyltransferase [bacterium]
MIIIEPYRGKSVAEERVEIVERKGTGHPDFICDSIMEAVSVALCAEYLKECGTILHHNIDKGLLVAGKVAKRYGGGKVLQPMELIIGDRATFEGPGKTLPVRDIAIDAARLWIRQHLRFVDPDKDILYRVVLAPGSEELTDIFSRPGEVRCANDTSAAVGYYPLSPTETAVLQLERHLNSPQFKKEFPQAGEDIKVMGLRKGTSLDLTVAMPLISRFIASEKDYFSQKEAIHSAMQQFAERLPWFKKTSLHYNTLDQRGRGLGGIYLSLTGTSAEDADSGQVGRGNRVNGLISLNRPMGTEAAAGKNPLSHVGKIYNQLSHKLARDIYQNIGGIREVYVLLLSRIGAPIDRPRMAAVRILPEKGQKVSAMAGAVEEIIKRELADINNFCQALGRGEYPVC